MSVVHILATPTTAMVKSPSRDIKNLISDVLSYKVEAADHMETSWDGVLSYYDYSSDRFPAGFLRLVVKTLKRHHYKVITKRKPAPEPTGPENPKVDDFEEDPRYDYQRESMEMFVKVKAGIIQAATGAGKSRIFKLCERRINLPTLFITTRKSLMYQMAENYQKTIGGSVGILGDGKWEPNYKGVNFAIVDTLASRLEIPVVAHEAEKILEKNHNEIEKEVARILKEKKLPTSFKAFKKVPEKLKQKVQKVRDEVEAKLEIPHEKIMADVNKKVARQVKRRKETLEFLKVIGFICLEEAHEVGSDGFYTIAQSCKNAHYRLALTATPFMRDSESANMRLMAVTGPIIYRVTEKLLIDRGILAKPYFAYASPPPPKKLYRSTAWLPAYRIGIIENKERNKVILKDILIAKHYGLTSMVLISQKAHGMLLEKAMKQCGIKACFIFGENKQKERDSALNKLRNGEIDCLIGSTILDVGIDVPSVGYVCLAGGGKAEVSARQRIGRGLREKKNGLPNVCFIRDFEDTGNNHLRKHAKERRRIVEETPGFSEGIVQRFEFQKLGFKKVA